MSFGFGVDDFLAVGGLCWKVYKKCKDSPGNYAQLSSEVGSLHNVIKETEEMLYQQDLTPEQKSKLAQSRQGCEEVLKDLDQLLNKYESMGTSARRAFDRMGFGMEDMTGIRVRLISNVTILDAFNNMCVELPDYCAPPPSLTRSRSSHARLETKLNLLIAEVRSGRREGSVISTQTFDTTTRNDRETWESLRKELEDIGISPSVLTEKRQFIIEWFQEAVAAGRLDEDAPSDHEDYATSSYGSGDPENEDESNIAASTEISSVMIEPPTREQGIMREFLSSHESRSEQPAVISHTESSRDKKKSRLRVSYLTNILRGRHLQFYVAASDGDIPKIVYLLQKGVDIDETSITDRGSPALLLAAKNGRAEAVKVLLDKGATLEFKNLDGNTALHLATQNGHKSIVQLLLDKGANVNITNSEYSTALHFAAENGHESIAKALLDKGAKIDAKDGYSNTALHLAARKRDKPVVQVLLDKGASIDVRNSSGYTALHCAAGSGSRSVVQVLLEKGANIEARDAISRTALMKAEAHNNLGAARLLREESELRSRRGNRP